MKKFLTALPLILALSSCQTAINSKAAKSESNANDTSKVIVANYQGGKVTLRDANEEITKLATQNAKLKGVSFYQLTADQKETIIKEAVLKEILQMEDKDVWRMLLHEELLAIKKSETDNILPSSIGHAVHPTRCTSARPRTRAPPCP